MDIRLSVNRVLSSIGLTAGYGNRCMLYDHMNNVVPSPRRILATVRGTGKNTGW